MKRDDLSHILRAAASVAGDGKILVIGSQAILATHPARSLPEGVTFSMGADTAFLEDPEYEKSDKAEGGVGEGWPFHKMRQLDPIGRA